MMIVCLSLSDYAVLPTIIITTQRGEDWVILAGDRNQARSIVKMKTDEDKMRVLGPHQVMAFNGEAGEYEHTAIADQVIAQAADAS